VTVSDRQEYHRAKYLVRAYPGTPEGMQAARWLAARHAAFLAQRGPVQTQADRNRIQREKYRRNPGPKKARNLEWYFSLTPEQMEVRRKIARDRLRDRWENEAGFRPRKLAYQRSRTRQRKTTSSTLARS